MNQKQTLFSLALCAALTGCATGVLSSYKENSQKWLENIYQGKLDTAMPEGDKQDVLYNMERGMLENLRTDYPNSNKYLEAAHQQLDAWTTRWLNTTQAQVQTQAISLLANDNFNDYEPKGYERSLLNTYQALNYLAMNDFDNARVSIKRMYQTEQAIQNYNQFLYNQAKLEQEKQDREASSESLRSKMLAENSLAEYQSDSVLKLKNSYQNSLGHYLAGFIFEALGEPSLARPGYVKAKQLNPDNKLIDESIANIDKGVKPAPGTTELLLIEEIGHAPQVESVQTLIPVNMQEFGASEECFQTINVFFPKLVPDKGHQDAYDIEINDRSIRPVPMVDTNLMASRAIADNVPHIVARNVAAAARNIALAKAACSNKDPGLGGLLNLGAFIGGVMLDRADERSMIMLPRRINISRISLPYGIHRIRLMVNGRAQEKDIALNQPYQIASFRVLGGQVFFKTQASVPQALANVRETPRKLSPAPLTNTRSSDRKPADAPIAQADARQLILFAGPEEEAVHEAPAAAIGAETPPVIRADAPRENKPVAMRAVTAPVAAPDIERLIQQIIIADNTLSGASASQAFAPTPAQHDLPRLDTTPVTEANATVTDSAPAMPTRWSLQLGAFKGQSNARQATEQLKSRGFNAFVASSEDGLFRVFVGQEAQRDAAEQLKRAVHQQLGKSGFVVASPVTAL